MKYRLFLAIVLIIFSFICIFTFGKKVFAAASLDSYTRTPSGSIINYGLNVNINGKITADTTVDSYKIRIKDIDGVNTVYSSCVDSNSDEIIFNEDFPSLAIGGYDYIQLFYYYGNNTCEDDPNAIILEENSGNEIFNIVTPPPSEVNTKKFLGSLIICWYISMVLLIIINNVSRIFSRPR